VAASGSFPVFPFLHLRHDPRPQPRRRERRDDP
jgi:hypothetical protein